MNSRQIYAILQPRLGENFCGVFASDKVPVKIESYPAGIVINTDPSDQPGKHWLALFVDSEKRAEYFDSFGRQPELPSILRLLKTSCVSYECSGARVQGFFSSVCGHYSVYFLLERFGGVSMREILEKFDADYEENDILVTDWINENFDLNTETYNADFLLSQVCRALSAAAEESVR